MATSSFTTSILAGLFLAIPASLAASPSSYGSLEESVPAAGVPEAHEGEVAPGRPATFSLTLAAGHFLRVTVEQRGIDLQLTLLAPGEEILVEVNEVGRPEGTEVLTAVTPVAGGYALVISATMDDAPAGGYRVEIEEPREATPADRQRVAAEDLLRQGRRLERQGGHESLLEAQNRYGAARTLFQELGDTAGEARALDSLGWVEQLLGRRQAALELLEQAVPLWRAAGDRRGEARTLQGIGVIYLHLGDVLRARSYLQQVIDLSRALGDRAKEAEARANLGGGYWILDQMEKAIEAYESALKVLQELGDRRTQASLLNNLGDAYRRLGDADTALHYFGQALEIRRAIGDRRGQAVSHQTTALVYHELAGDLESALGHYQEALALRREVGDRVGQGYTLDGLGRILLLQGQTAKAREHFEEALQHFREAGERRGEAEALGSLGEAYLALGERSKAREVLNQALALNRQIGVRTYEARVLAVLARLEREEGDLQAARSAIEEALEIAESLRQGIASQRLRTSYFATVESYYDFYVDLLMELHQSQPREGYDGLALAASERRRARTLLEVLHRPYQELRLGVDAELLAEEEALEELQTALEVRRTRLLLNPEAEGQVEALAAVEEELEDVLQRQQAHQDRIAAAHPGYAALLRPRPLSVRQLQAEFLGPETLLLEYHLGEERSFLWAVTESGLRTHLLPPRGEIEAEVRQAYEQITARNRWPPGEAPKDRRTRLAVADQAYRQISTTLSQQLLGPVADLLTRPYLLVVGDGPLHYLAFAALPRPGPGEAWRPLVADHVTVNLPSASVVPVIRRERTRRPAPEDLLAVMADPVFVPEDPRVASSRPPGQAAPSLPREPTSPEAVLVRDALRSTAGPAYEGYPRLRFSREEAQAIARLASPEATLTALDFAASRETVTRGDLDRFRILHFATHGILNTEQPESSGLVLSLVDREGRPQNGYLRLPDIYNLDLRADLVVLSACQTALGQEIRGEGLVGLTRGFLYAGAAAVVASLWQVQDRATAELMKRLYGGMLQRGIPPADSLAAVQRTMWGDDAWQAPYYWAGFVFQGDWR